MEAKLRKNWISGARLLALLGIPDLDQGPGASNLFTIFNSL